MPSLLRCFHRCGLCGLIGALAVAATLHGAESVAITTASGRKFTAEVDASSTAARLWLRADRPGIRLLRPLDWDRVVAVTAGNQTLSGAEFRDLIEAKRWPVATDPFVDSPQTPPRPDPLPTSPSDADTRSASQAMRRNGLEIASPLDGS